LKLNRPDTYSANKGEFMIDFIIDAPTLGDSIYNGLIVIAAIIWTMWAIDFFFNKGRNDER